MTSDQMLTPREVEDALGLSAPATRRAAVTYEAVFGLLPRIRGQEGPRRWPLEALRRVQVAHAALEAGRVPSLEHALTLIREGQELPAPVEMPERPDPAAALLSLVEALRGEIAQLRQELATTQLQALPVPAHTEEALRVVIRQELADALSDRSPERAASEIRAVVQDELERLRVLLHASTQTVATVPLTQVTPTSRGLLARLWGALRG
jgi:DNA-binding transcriptional MerR regulator